MEIPLFVCTQGETLVLLEAGRDVSVSGSYMIGRVGVPNWGQNPDC